MRFSRFIVWIGVVVGLCSFAVTSKADPQKPKEWAFLIFMNGHNNLSSFTDLNINQLETVGSTADIDVVVQWAKLGAKNTYRLHIQKDDDMNKVTSPVIETMPRQDMGDYRNLVEFVRWAQEKYPAKHYMVSFWNHGSGWHRQVVNPVRAISSDDYTGHSISTEEMGVALDQIAKIIGHRVEIVGADACLKLNRAVTALADRHRYAEATAICHEIEALEDRGAATMREAITRLFAVEGDEAAAWHAMKMRRFYTAQEDVLYNCKRAAHTIEEIVLENQ